MLDSPSASLPRRGSSPSTSDLEKVSSPRPISPSPAAQAQPSTQQQNSSTRNRPLAELIGAPFPPFDGEALVAQPCRDERMRDQAFQKELNAMLLAVILETHAWSSARPFHETETAVRKFEEQLTKVQEHEVEQEKTRQRLHEFITRMKDALNALTGLL